MSSKIWCYWNFLPDMLREIDKLETEELKQKYMLKIIDSQIEERKEKIPDIINRLKKVKATRFVSMNELFMDQFKEALDDYVNGLDLSCISIGGVLAEAIVLDLFERTDILVKGRELTNQHKRAAFSNLSQEVKIDLLLEFTIIDDETAGKLHQIRDRRNEFVHPKQLRKANETDSLIIINLLTDVIHKVYSEKYITVDVLIKFIQSLRL